MTKYKYEVVKHVTSKTVKCSACGRRLVRKCTVWQTLNPFNKNSSGEPKNRHEILAELYAEAAAWQAKGETCQRHAR